MPKLRSRRLASVAIGRPITSAIARAVSSARFRSLATIASMPSPASASPARAACQRPRALSAGVELALHAHLGVPLGLAVPHDDHARGLRAISAGAAAHELSSRLFSV